MVNQTKKPHVHAECIKAWADGAIIQFQYRDGSWAACTVNPTWDPECRYRIKPEPKPDVVHYGMAGAGNLYTTLVSHRHKAHYHNLKLTFDGETGKLKKAEVIG